MSNIKKSCKKGLVRSRKTGRCRSKSLKKSCKKGLVRSRKTGRCRSKFIPRKKSYKKSLIRKSKPYKKSCKKSLIKNRKTGRYKSKKQKNLKKRKLKMDGVDTEDECSICLEKFENQHDKFTSSCQHSFHNLCIDTWLRQRNTCPYCRRNIIILYDLALTHFQRLTNEFGNSTKYHVENTQVIEDGEDEEGEISIIYKISYNRDVRDVRDDPYTISFSFLKNDGRWYCQVDYDVNGRTETNLINLSTVIIDYEFEVREIDRSIDYLRIMYDDAYIM